MIPSMYLSKMAHYYEPTEINMWEKSLTLILSFVSS